MIPHNKNPLTPKLKPRNNTLPTIVPSPTRGIDPPNLIFQQWAFRIRSDDFLRGCGGCGCGRSWSGSDAGRVVDEDVADVTVWLAAVGVGGGVYPKGGVERSAGALDGFEEDADRSGGVSGAGCGS